MRVDAHLACALAAALILTGCATSTANKSAAASPTPNTSASTARDSTCLTSTGTRLPVTANSRCTGIGRSYSGENIGATGKTQAGQALSMLDPSITVSH